MMLRTVEWLWSRWLFITSFLSRNKSAKRGDQIFTPLVNNGLMFHMVSWRALHSASRHFFFMEILIFYPDTRLRTEVRVWEVRGKWCCEKCWWRGERYFQWTRHPDDISSGPDHLTRPPSCRRSSDMTSNVELTSTFPLTKRFNLNIFLFFIGLFQCKQMPISSMRWRYWV